MQTGEHRKYRDRLLRLSTRRVIVLLLISAVLFSAAQLSAVFIGNENNARHHLEELKSSLILLDDLTVSYLRDSGTQSAALALLRTSETEAMGSSFRRFTLSCPISGNLIVADAEGSVRFTSFSDNEYSSFLDNYNRAICLHAADVGEGDVYRAVYFDSVSYADRMMVLPLREDGVLRGFLTVFLSGSSWNYYLSNSGYDGVITDLRSNIMYISRSGIADSFNRFISKEHGVVTKNDQRFWVVSETLPEQSAAVYSLVYYPRSMTFFVALFFLLLIGVLWLAAARAISRAMARYNAENIEAFIRELDLVRRGDPSYRIQWPEDDEFRQVAEHTNEMLDTVYQLNDRNTELIQLNNRIEREQLTAQMNPHFLYNTLEIIRSLALYDGQRAEEIISCLTRVLRYSADATESEVPLSRDLTYIGSYLDIQRCRFGNRFSCTLDIDEACMSCLVPKLFLQPLIENSIKFGFRNQMELSVAITGRLEEDLLVFHVEDNGGGMPTDRAAALQEQLITHDKSSPSIGLRNLSRRLYLKYGNAGGIRIRNREGQGLDVIVTLARIKEETNVQGTDR